MKALDQCTNMFGHLSPEYRKKLERYINTVNPTAKQWDEVSGVIIDFSKEIVGVWNAMIELDPTFPRTGATTDVHGKILKDWERIPTGFEVARAIQNHFAKK